MKRLILFAIAATAWSAVAAPAEIRLATIALEEDARGPADLLTAALSAQTNLVLLERTEADKTIREQSLAANEKADVNVLGKALHADGLVLVQIVRSAAYTNLAVRLVAVNSGVVLDAIVAPLPSSDPAQWSRIILEQMRPFFPKLEVTRNRAVPISLLNLRAAAATPRSARTERLLTTLLFHRLVLEPDVFVLERKEMGRLQWEKELALDETAFWNGGYLLEGLIDRDGFQAATITVHARLLPPGGRVPVEITLTGPRQDLAGVVERLARQILSSTQREPAVAAWDRDKEAERFDVEASWAFRWRMWPEAYSAAEVAWTLGRHTESVATIKLRSLLEQIHPDDAWIVDPVRNFRISDQAREFDRIANTGWTRNVPLPTDVPNALETASTYAAQSRSPEAWRTNKSWLALGSNVLNTASAVLRHQYLFGWRTNNYDPDVGALREAVRTLAGVLPPDQVREAFFKAGGFWQETPQDRFRVLREALRSEDRDRDLQWLLVREWTEPLWVGWTPADRANGANQWQAFVAELQASTNRSIRAEGALLKLLAARFDPEIALASEEFLDAVMDGSRRDFSPEVSFKFLDAFDVLLNSRAADTRTLRRQRLVAAWKEHQFARQKHFFQTAKFHDSNRTGSLYMQAFTQSQAQELLPVFDDYTRRLGIGGLIAERAHLQDSASKPEDAFTAFFAAPNFDPEQFRAVFINHQFTLDEARRLAGPVRVYANRLGWPDDVRDVDARLQALLASSVATTNRANDRSEAGFTCSRYFRPEFKSSEPDGARYGRFVAWMVSGNKIFAMALRPNAANPFTSSRESYRLFEIDVNSGSSTLFPQAIQAGQYQSIKFTVAGNQCFWIDGEAKIGRLDCRSGELREFDVELPLWRASITSAGNRVFLTSEEFIAEFSGEGSVELLAGKRRTPAASRLDDWAGWTGEAKLWLNRSHELFAHVGGTNVWIYNPSTRDWDGSTPAHGTSDAPWTVVNSRTRARYLDETVWIDGRRECLLSSDRTLLSRWPIPFDYSVTWDVRAESGTIRVFDGTNYCILLRPMGQSFPAGGQSGFPNGQGLKLLWFSPDWEMPATIPLAFEGQATDASSPAMPTGLAVTPVSGGLIFSQQAMMFMPQSGFWFISWTELRDWVAGHQANRRTLVRREPERRRKFDLNHDGQLDADEMSRMLADREWQQADNKLNVRRMLLTFDLDGDGRLNAAELEPLGNFINTGSASRSGMGPGGFSPLNRRRDPQSLLSEYDLDHDKFISGDELTALYGELAQPAPAQSLRGQRFLPGMPPSGFIPTNGASSELRVSPEYLNKYDRNHNGRLDPEERHEMLPERVRNYDRNTNGVLEPDELKALQADRAAPRRPDGTNAPDTAPRQ